jgi:hypothetical protein
LAALCAENVSLCALSACERNEKVIAVEDCRHRQCSCKSLSSPHQAREVIKLLKKALVRTKVQIDIAAYNKFSFVSRIVDISYDWHCSLFHI